MAEPRYVIIHGHFYQPPRESPWTGLISPEPGAAPFPNWNETNPERVLHRQRACAHHGRARGSYPQQLRLAQLRLRPDADWMAGAPWRSTAYRAIRRGDQLSVAEHGGHGNAIAQSYNHSILPLLRPRDRAVADRLGDRGFRLPLRAPARRDVAAGMRRRRRHAARRSRRPESNSSSWRPSRARFSGRGAERRGAGPFIWRSEI